MEKEKENNSISRRQFMGRAATLSAFFIVPRYVLGGKGYVAPSDQITLGFIGVGKQGTGLQQSFLSTGEVQILAACDVYAAKTKNFIDKANAFYADKAGKTNYKSCSP